MNFQLKDSQKVPYAVSESDKAGNVVPPAVGDTVSVTSDSAGSLTVVADAAVDGSKVPNNADGTAGDPANYLQTGFLVGGTTPKTGVAVTVTISHADGSPAPSPITDLIDVVVGEAVTANISLGTPVSE